MSKDNYITLTEAADLLKTSKSTVIRRLNKLGAKKDKFTYKEGKVKYIDKKLIEANFQLDKYNKDNSDSEQKAESLHSKRNYDQQLIKNLIEESANKTKQLITKDKQIEQQQQTIAELTERQKEVNILILKAEERTALLVQQNSSLQKQIFSLSAPVKDSEQKAESLHSKRNVSGTLESKKEDVANSRQSFSYAAFLLFLLVSLAAAGAFLVAQLF